MLNQFFLKCLQYLLAVSVCNTMQSSQVQKNSLPASRPSLNQREAASGVGRLKWDSKVRMKQAKLRAAGENKDRQEVVESIIEESVEAAQDGVMERFDEIARERGFHEGGFDERLSTITDYCAARFSCVC